MREDGEQLGRFKVRSLMRELDLVSKQPGSHAYKRATVERLDIPNTLNREFDVPAPNQVWCGDITYIWAQGLSSKEIQRCLKRYIIRELYPLILADLADSARSC